MTQAICHALAIGGATLHIKSMRIVIGLIVIALMALLGASLYYAYGIWTALGAADMPGWMYAAMAGGVVFSLLVGGGLMGLVFYSSRAGYDDEAAHNDNSSGVQSNLLECAIRGKRKAIAPCHKRHHAFTRSLRQRGRVATGSQSIQASWRS